MRATATRPADGTMALGAHLNELRRRGFRAAIALVVGVVAGWFLADPVLALLHDPIAVAALQQHRPIKLNFGSVSAAFDLRVQIAVVAGIVIASPVWLYQLFAFFMPALTSRERRFSLGFTLAAVPLFLGGCAAGVWVVPHIVALLTAFAPADSLTYLDARSYFDFVLRLVLITGVAFVLPLVLVMLNFAGVVSGLAILKAWRWAVLAIFLFTAIATPAADVMAMLLLAIPMVLLYVGACGLALVTDRRRARALGAAGIPQEVEV